MAKPSILLITIISLLTLFFSCDSLVKNKDAKVIIEEGTQIDSISSKTITKENDLLGSYVGMFEIDAEDSVIDAKAVSASERFHWTRENKITLFIDSIGNKYIKGHSIVAGNNSPFEGIISKTDSAFLIEAKETEGNKYDGAFSFTLKDTVINGTWKAFAKVEIEKRKYSLVKKIFRYDQNLQLSGYSKYVDWRKPETTEKEKKQLKAKMTKEEWEEFEEFDEDTRFVSATDKIYTINASNTLLSEKEVANLTKGDLLIIRNSIYARHGYSFKLMQLRVFFDRQPWYMPVTTDIKNAFTEIEKKNIPLLLKYEKLAKEYYDYFGRG